MVTLGGYAADREGKIDVTPSMPVVPVPGVPVAYLPATVDLDKVDGARTDWRDGTLEVDDLSYRVAPVGTGGIWFGTVTDLRSNLVVAFYSTVGEAECKQVAHSRHGAYLERRDLLAARIA